MEFLKSTAQVKDLSRWMAALALIAVSSGAAVSAKADPAKNAPECAKVVAACEAPGADFKPGAHKTSGMGLWIDCVRKLAKGETVPGVSGVTKEEAAKCLAEKKEIRKAKKAAAAGGH